MNSEERCKDGEMGNKVAQGSRHEKQQERARVLVSMGILHSVQVARTPRISPGLQRESLTFRARTADTPDQSLT